MGRSKGKATLPYTEAQTTVWLSWLARGMQQNGETVFLIEKLQPSWLPTHTQRWIYTFSSRLNFALFFAFFGLILGMCMNKGQIPYEAMVLPFLFLGLPFGFADSLRFEYSNLWVKLPIYMQFLLLPLSAMLIFGLMSLLIPWHVHSNLISMLFVIGVNYAMFGVIWSKYGCRSLYSDIRTVETLRWSWPHARKGFGIYLLIGLFIIFILFLINVDYMFLVLLFFLFWVPTGLIFKVIRGLRRGMVEMKTVPNQGIKLSIRSAILGAGFVAPVFALFIGGIVCFIEDPITGLEWGLISVLIIWLSASFFYGGIDVIKHYTLRLILYLKGYTPFNYVRFLDYAANELNFLQKVGGGYIFIHRFLLEHFAAMEKPIKYKISSEPAEKQA